MRVAIVGGGLAGALLAWRLTQLRRPVDIDVYLGDRGGTADATDASGGLVRGYETDPGACRAATESLAELRASAVLRQASDYREVGSVYLRQAGADLTDALRTVGQLLPGSAQVAARAELTRRYPFRGLPADTVGIVERHAGHLSPARLRTAALGWAAAAGTTVHPGAVTGVTPAPAVRLPDGVQRHYDAVVVAAGPWTPGLLGAGTAHPGRLRTRQIQYSVHPVGPGGLGAFVDETSGLYGRPVTGGAFLLGLPSARWDVQPAAVEPDAALADRVGACARHRFGAPIGDAPAIATVAALDCYLDPPGLALRPIGPGSALFTFTGGSGGAAKTVLAASRTAAGDLLRLPSLT